MKSLKWVVGAVLAVGLAALPVLAQEAAKKDPPKPFAGPAADAVAQWNEIGRKVIAMAEDYPEDKYDYKPTPEVRTFAEQLLHVAGFNFVYVAVVKGEKPGDDNLPRDKYKTKAAVVEVLKKSFADASAVIKLKGDKGIMAQIKNPFGNEMTTLYSLAQQWPEHSGEHYGQLVFYYRMNGMVPPESRPKK